VIDLYKKEKINHLSGALCRVLLNGGHLL